MKKLVSLLLASMMVLTLSTGALALVDMDDPLANPFGSTQLVKEPGSVTITFGISQSVNVSSYEDNYMTNWLKEKTGVNIAFELFPSADANNKLDLMVASGSPLPDLLCFGMDDANRRYNYGSNGAIIPLNEYYEKYGEPFYNRCASLGLDGDRVLKEYRSVDGNIYASPYKDNNYANYYSYRAFINKTWLDKLGLEIPTNYEELVTVLTAFRDLDPNGNGEKDEIPMMGGDQTWQGRALGYLQNMFIYYNDLGDPRVNQKHYLPLSETDGKIDVSYDKQEYRDFLIYANTLVSEGLLSPLTFTQDNSQFSALKRQDPAVIGVVCTGGAVDLYFGNSPDEYVPFEVMKGPEGVQWQTASLNFANGRAAITADCEHPDIAFGLLNYGILNEETHMIFFINRWGEPDVDFRFAEEGEISMFDMEGFPPKLLQINSTWGTLGNKHWQGVDFFTNLVDPLEIMEVFNGDANNDEYQYAVNYSYNKKHAPAFDSLVPPLAYTEEETDRWTDARTALSTYVTEARTLFATGQLDPNSDADWDNYLAEIARLQYKELIEVDQAAYDRMMAD